MSTEATSATPTGTDAAGASAVLGTTEALTPAQAIAQIEKFKGDAAFRKQLLAGSAETKAQWKALLQAAHPQSAQPEQTEPNRVDIGILKEAGISLDDGDVGADLKALLTGKPTSAAVKAAADSRFQALKRDRAFVQRWLDGGAEERRVMTVLTVLRSAKVEAA